MDEYINGIKNKYGYSEELTNFLSQLIPTLIKYYGEEHKNTILSALSECEIHFQCKEENTENYLNSYFGVNKEWEIPLLPWCRTDPPGSESTSFLHSVPHEA